MTEGAAEMLSRLLRVESPAGTRSDRHGARAGNPIRDGKTAKKTRAKLSKAQVENARLFGQWETFVGILSISEGTRVLGVDWRTYRKYRTGEVLPLATRYAMQAIAHKLPAWGDE